VTFLSVPSAPLALILAPFGQSDFALRLFGFSLELLLWISHFFAQFEGNAGHSDRAMPIGSMLLATFALAAVISANGAARFVLGGAFAAASLLVWSQAPRFVAHWSPSGELFFAEGDRQVNRIEVTDGGGLVPLRYDTAALGSCLEADCLIETKNGTFVRILRAPNLEVCLSLVSAGLGSASDPCLQGRKAAASWLWSDIEPTGGVTL